MLSEEESRTDPCSHGAALQQRKQRESVMPCGGGAVYLHRIKIREGNSIHPVPSQGHLG